MKLLKLMMIGLVATVYPVCIHAETITVSIIEQNDDAEEAITGPNAGNVRRSSTDLEIGNENGVEQWIGLRFQDISIPPGSVINSAKIQFTAEDTDVGNLIVPILGELSLAPNEFRDVTPLTGRTLTSAVVDWDIQPWFPGDRNDRTTTPNLATIVQEIIDQPGWELGNAIAFLMQNDPMDTSERLAVSFDGDPLNAAELTIDFTAQDPSGIANAISLISGVPSFGALEEILTSDNVDFVARRNPSQIAAVVEVEVDSVSINPSPATFEFTVESSAFYRTPVSQTIRLFNFTTQVFEVVDSRAAPRFSDQVVSIAGAGDLSRFVEPGTGLVRARVSYSSAAIRQSFSVSIDHIFWSIQ